MKITQKQKAFADYYIELGNATEAYKKAYNCKNDGTARTESSKNLAKPNIKNYIDEKMKEIENDRIAKADEVLSFLTSSLRGETKEEVVTTTTDKEGNITSKIIKKQLSARDRIKCAELLGKRYLLFTDKVSLETPEELAINITYDYGDDDDKTD